MGGVFLVGLVSRDRVFMHLKAILMFMCLKMLVMCKRRSPILCDYLGVWGTVWVMFCCILCFSRVSRRVGKIFLCAMCSICCHSLSCCSLSSGRVSILLMRKL